MLFRLLVCVAVAVAVLIPQAEADNWPQWRGPNRNGVSDEKGWLDNWPPTLVWTQFVNVGYSGAAVVDDRLYTMGYSEKAAEEYVYCLDALTGSNLWSHSYGCSVDTYGGYPGSRATPAVGPFRVYTYGHDGQLRAFGRISGTPGWSRTLDAGAPWWGCSASPLIEGDNVIVNVGMSGHAVRRAGGTDVWQSPSSSRAAGYASPLAITWNSQRTILIRRRIGLVGVNADTGATNFWFSTDRLVETEITDPVVWGNNIFMSYHNGAECWLIPMGPGELTATWTNWDLSSGQSTCVLIDDHLYGFRDEFNGDLVCMDISDGSIVWEELNLFGDGEGMIIAADGKLIVLSQSGKLAIIDASPTGYNAQGRDFVDIIPGGSSELWASPPSLANGMIYCRSHEGTLACLRVGGAPSDLDGDNVADTWEQEHFDGTNNCAPSVDDDGDGSPNDDEYDAGTDPTNENSFLSLELELSNGVVVVSWPTRTVFGIGYDESLSRYYAVQVRTGLVDGAWSPEPGYGNVLGDDTTATYTGAPPADVKFYGIGARME